MQAARTVFLLQDLRAGGTQLQTLALAGGLSRSRFSPELWTLSGPGENAAAECDAKARELELPVTHLAPRKSSYPAALAALWRKLGHEKPDIFFLCTALPNIWGRIFGAARKLPLVLGSCRGGGAPFRQHERLLWRLARHIVCNSAALIEVMTGIGVPRRRMTYIANGVDTRRFTPGGAPLAGRDPVVLCVARLAGDKDHACLLDAFALTLRQMPEARLRLIGEGPLEAKVRARMAETPLAGRVELLPASSDVAAACRDARVFALSSLREGTPNVLLEAMACGLPVAATHVGGIPFLIGENGLTVPAGDSAALAEGMLRILRDPELATRMGHAGRTRVERDFSLESMIGAHEKLFLRMLARGEDSRPPSGT